MKKAILLLVLIVTFSCKDEKKKESDAEVPEVVTEQVKLIKSFTSVDLAAWSKVRVNLEPTTDEDFTDEVYKLSRISITESAYLSSNKVPVIYASKYKATIIVKKGTESDLFGLRMSGSYPDRVDALFNLSTGTILDYKSTRDFETPVATIEELPAGWYLCTVSAKVAADDVRIILGATSTEKKATSWEGTTETLGDVYFVPSSIKLEEVIN